MILLTPNANAESYRLQVREKSCQTTQCRIATGYGTCFAIGVNNSGHYVFISAEHVVRGSEAQWVQIDDQWIPARVVSAVNSRTTSIADPGFTDIAILEVATKKAVKCYPLATAHPSRGMQAIIQGYGAGEYKEHSTTIAGQNSAKNIVRQGDSGGPILVESKVVGVVWSHDAPEYTSDPETHFTNAGVVRTLLRRRYGRIPRCPQIVPTAPIVKTIPVPGQCVSGCRCKAGKVGARGPQGPPGRDGAGIDSSELIALKTEIANLQIVLVDQQGSIEKLKPLLRRKLILYDANKKIIDQDDLSPSDPIKILGRYKSLKK